MQVDVRDAGSIPELGRSLGGMHGNPLQYSCLENPIDRGAWRATVHRVTKSQTQLKRLSTDKGISQKLRKVIWVSFIFMLQLKFSLSTVLNLSGDSKERTTMTFQISPHKPQNLPYVTLLRAKFLQAVTNCLLG